MELIGIAGLFVVLALLAALPLIVLLRYAESHPRHIPIRDR